jgi:tripartite ATP-independent transporter DctP family solute receptor
MKKLFFKNFNLVVLTIFLIFMNCGKVSNVRILKLAHVLPTDHPVHKGMVIMADKVVEKSGGKMQVDIYPGGQLGAERDLIELLQIGSLAMTKVSSAPLEGFVPDMKIFGVPYIFRDDEHRWKVMQGEIGRRLLLAAQKFYLRGLCYYDAGYRSFYTKEKPITSPDDLQGMKIRVMKSITSVQMVDALGGSPTPIPWGELYTALQQGVVDGAENNAPSLHTSLHYEVCKFYSLDEHTSYPDILLMSTVVWESLTAQQQQWLQEAVDESVEEQKILWKEAVDKALKVFLEAGGKINYPDKEPFREKVKSMYELYNGTSIYDLIQEISAIQ